jgi:uncharacterized membrane protein YgcG
VVVVHPPNKDEEDEDDLLLPTFRSLASFGSTADLAKMNQQRRAGSNAELLAPLRPSSSNAGSSTDQQRPPDIMRALASFGSRTALNVLAQRSAGHQRRRSGLQLEQQQETIEEEEEEEDDEDEEARRQRRIHDKTHIVEEEEEYAGQYVDIRGTRVMADGTLPSDEIDLGVTASPLHPYVEAMCDRIHSPLQGTRLRWTPCGKLFIWILIFILTGFMLICQSWDLVEIHKKGLAGDLIVKPIDRYRLYSLVSFTGSVTNTGYEVPAFELSTLFFLMTAVMPCATVLGLAMMWTIPLTLDQQSLLFNWLEIASAWSSLDIFFISIIAIYIELGDVTDKILSDAVPKLSELIHLVLPFEEGVMSADMKIKDGFWILLVAVIFEKIAIYLITEQAVTSISERRVEKFLRELARQGAQASGQSHKSSQLGGRGGGGSSGAAGAGGGIDTGLLGDAAEGLLETEAMLVFAPAGRYASAMFPKQIYAGLPRSWWVKIGVRTGLLADAKTVTRYDLTGEWFDLDTASIPPKPFNGHHRQQQSDHTYYQMDEDEFQQPKVPPSIIRTSLSSDRMPMTTTTTTKKAPPVVPKSSSVTYDESVATTSNKSSNNTRTDPIISTTTVAAAGQQQAVQKSPLSLENKRVSWGRLDEDNTNNVSTSKLSIGGEEDGPLSF